jgi:hypothetical protein
LGGNFLPLKRVTVYNAEIIGKFIFLCDEFLPYRQVSCDRLVNTVIVIVYAFVFKPEYIKGLLRQLM